MRSEVGVGISIAVRVRGEVVLEEERTHLKKLRDGLSVIPSDAWRKALRRLDAAGGRFYRITGNRDGAAGPAGIGSKQLVVRDPCVEGSVVRASCAAGLPVFWARGTTAGSTSEVTSAMPTYRNLAF